QGLRPEALDARATPARLDGPLTLSGGAGQPLQARLDLRGTLQQRPLRLQAKVQGRLHERGSSWQIADTQLASGDAQLQASGSVDATDATKGAPLLAAKLKTQLRQFDPHLLWRGEPGSAWARLPGATRLNADVALDLRGNSPDNATGTAEAAVLPSQFGGLPLEGRMTLARARAAEPAAFDINARLGQNRIQATGDARPDLVASRLKLQAVKLAELNPLLALFDQGPIAGSVEGDGDLSLQRVKPASLGKLKPKTMPASVWQLGGSGNATLKALSAHGISVESAKASWALPLPGDGGDAPLALQVEAGGVRQPQAQLKLVKLDLQGRRSAHELKLQLAGRIPRNGQDLNLGATLQAQGGWDGRAWNGRIARLDVAPLLPNTPAALAASNVALRLGLDDAGVQLTVQPGRAEVGGAFVRWQALDWRGGDRPELRAELQLEDLAVAPLLARWQPDFGWSGDLRMTGHASLLLNERLTAELLVERQGGDLRVTDEFGPRALGLTDLRLALNVRDGVWQFAQGLAGKDLGGLGGALALRPTGL
ncbi:MAG TPA: hypothetical protein VGE36_11155, partial [Roseateles sp.]